MALSDSLPQINLGVQDDKFSKHVYFVEYRSTTNGFFMEVHFDGGGYGRAKENSTSLLKVQVPSFFYPFLRRKFCNCNARKGGIHLVPGPFYMVDALKFLNQALSVSGESLQTCVAWHCPDGTQHLICWPIMAAPCRSQASKGQFLNGLPGAIFQQDNVRPHTARGAQDFLRHFQSLPWPARSPGLSPVEHVLDQLKRQMPSCHSVHDLEFAAQVLWAHLLQDNIRCLINSMPDRAAACIAPGGGPTCY
ncbi:transposable element Tcb2 transposase [Trichonephila clavipes]|nr:transposable element Tcb2 transposase [Trichonephila clavipes]